MNTHHMLGVSMNTHHMLGVSMNTHHMPGVSMNTHHVSDVPGVSMNATAPRHDIEVVVSLLVRTDTTLPHVLIIGVLIERTRD